MEHAAHDDPDANDFEADDPGADHPAATSAALGAATATATVGQEAAAAARHPAMADDPREDHLAAEPLDPAAVPTHAIGDESGISLAAVDQAEDDAAADPAEAAAAHTSAIGDVPESHPATADPAEDHVAADPVDSTAAHAPTSADPPNSLTPANPPLDPPETPETHNRPEDPPLHPSTTTNPTLTITDLAHQTGLTVKALRYYSDIGLVPTVGRDTAGRRQYRQDAVARVRLIRTLRALGIAIRTIRALLDKEADLTEVAQQEANRVSNQIHELQTRHTILQAIAHGDAGDQELDIMQDLSATARKALVNDFLEAVFITQTPASQGLKRTLTPELPDDPTPAQLAAWTELTDLTQDQDFRTLLRSQAEQQHGRTPDVLARIAQEATTGDPTGPQGAAAVRRVNPTRQDLVRITQATDPRRDRYLRLLAEINGWAAPTDLAPKMRWFETAVRRHSPNLLAR
ncbi:MerR family transcriptional regulator [Amycolatopsis rhabdoformis]|uniref:MerR family transcriptional regulator n=1 Tax=Amycolatopsis rhabdoformis TaxID=1448059 RepID=A0ABZ1I3H8_9PSEU|nr:MerR family transcriptional regulator [Amycolatopsis rhabdoformis]WSE28491.1 MerR family transcriptional regulator [Amycolatopsis rhabdoformis]